MDHVVGCTSFGIGRHIQQLQNFVVNFVGLMTNDILE